MYYKQKYIKYKLKYLNLVGGEPKVIDLKKCHPIIIAKKIIGELLLKPYSLKNYNIIKAMYISILNTDSNTQLTDINNSQKCVLKEEILFFIL